MSWKDAATLLLIRPLANKAKRVLQQQQLNGTVFSALQRYQEKTDYEIYVGIRSAKLKFFASSVAFPGGAIETEDSDAGRWQSILSQPHPCVAIPSSCLFVRLPVYERPSSSTVLDRHMALRLCAIRELAEETGLLLSQKSNTSPVSDAFHSQKFVDTVATLGRLPAVNMLYDWRCWLTPKIGDTTASKKTHRFDTIFYMAFIENANEQLFKLPQAKDGELGSLKWSTVPELVADYLSGKLSFPPPQFHEFMTLLRYSSFSQLKEFVTKEMNHDKLERWLPVRAQFAGEDVQLATLLPGDSFYPKTVKEAIEVEYLDFPETFSEHCAKSERIHRLIWVKPTEASQGKPVLKFVCNFDSYTTGQLTPLTDFTDSEKSHL